MTDHAFAAVGYIGLATPNFLLALILMDVLLAALGRGWRWRRMLDGGDYATSGDLAAAVWVAHSYVCRHVRLTLLAPDIVETILDGRQPRGMTLGALLKVTSRDWDEQRRSLGWTGNAAVEWQPGEATIAAHDDDQA